MKRTSLVTWLSAVFVLSLALGAWAETLPLVIWQKEKRVQPQEGQTLRLQRGPFTLVAPLQGKEDIAVVAAFGPRPDKMTAFDPGHGMAGPYDGLYLTWEGAHYFFVDDSLGDKRMGLWDRQRGLSHWKARRLFDNTGSRAKQLSWENAPPLSLIVRKKGFEDLNFRVIWAD